MQCHVLYHQSVDVPTCLVGIVDGDIYKRQVFHLAEEFWRVDDAVFHHHVVAVPDGTAAARGEIAVRDFAPLDMPKGIFSLETALFSFDIAAFLDARLSLGNGYIFKA